MPKEIVYTLFSSSAAQTEALAESLAKILQPGDCLLFYGELGVGKTTFIRGLAKGLGIPASEPVNSPTFAIIHEYLGRVPVYHFDLYRLTNVAELTELCFADYVGGSGEIKKAGVVVIEWAERLNTMLSLLPSFHYRLQLSYAAGAPTHRELRLIIPPTSSIMQERTAAVESWYKERVRGHEA